MRRLAGGERSTRFESTSQYSQLPLQVEQSRKTEESQGARCSPQGKHHAGTPERSNPNRELVKRKPSSDGRRRIRKRGRKLTRASEGRRGAFAHRVNPTEVWNKVARRRKGSRMRRLAGGERSTRFEPASQHSQLPHLRTGGLPSKSTIDDCAYELLHQAVFSTLSLTPKFYARGPIISSGRTHSSNCSLVNPSSKADIRNVIPFSCAFFAIFAALSYPMWLFNAVTSMSEFSRCD